MENRARKRWEVAVREYATPLPGSRPYTNERPVRVTAPYDGATLEEFLARRFPHVDESAWRAVIEEGLLRRGERRLQPNDRVTAGDRLVHVRPNTIEPDVSLDIEWLYEDAAVLAIGKPAPLPIHPSGRFNKNTLTSILQGARPDVRLYVVHRLDAETTGVVIFAKSPDVARHLGVQFEWGRVEKEYLAVVRGRPSWTETTCDAPIDRRTGPSGSRGVGDGGQPSRTEFRVLHPCGDDTLVVARPASGRTHQIRIHCAAIGHAILGDRIYGAPPPDVPLDGSTLRLHAWKLTIELPGESKLALEAPPPAWGSSRIADPRGL